LIVCLLIPAATGFNGLCGTFIYRNQWDRVQDAPNTSVLNIQARLPRNFSTGISLSHDAIGFQRNSLITVNGAYHLRTYLGHLSAGIGLGLINVGFSGNWIPPQTMQDPLLPDPVAGTAFDANLGLFWHGSTAPYYVGVSSTHLVPSSLDAINFQVARHYYIIAGYDYRVKRSVRQINIKPSVLIKADGASAIFDLNVMGDFWLNDFSYLWAGLTYRMSDAIAIHAGYAFSPRENTKMDMMKIGYSFDIMTNPLNEYGRGTHELVLNFCLFPELKGRGKHGNPFILER
jgi:type IX secretion system PorP/SprF family membrane protein